jgi:hypothetical protein
MSPEDKNSRRRRSSSAHHDVVGDLPEEAHYLDELSRALDEGAISRGQALKWAGYGVLGAALSSMGFADTAEALGRRQRRRCRNKGGTPLERGECHCAYKCGANVDRFVCENNPSCACVRTIEGRGFCGDVSVGCPLFSNCSSSSECPSGMRCVIPKPIISLGTCCRSGFGFPASVCVPACPPTTSSTQQHAASRVSGPTPGGPSVD